MALTTNGGGFIHNATVANDFTLTSENMLLKNSFSISSGNYS